MRETPAGTTPQATPGSPAGRSLPPSPPTGGRSKGKNPRGARPRRDLYATWLTEAQALDLVRLAFRLRAELDARQADPAQVAKDSGYARLSALLSLDWSDIRRTRLSTLHRIGTAAGIDPATVNQIAAAYPHAISEEASR